MEKEELIGYNVTFTAPSGYEYTIREQNGADDDILSNPSEASTLINISRFIAGIVIDTNYTANRKLTVLIANHWMNTYLIIQRKLMMILWLVNQML